MTTTTTRFRRTTIALVALTVVLSAFGAVGTVSAQSVSVSNSPSTATAAPGDTVTITTTVSGSDVNGQGLQVSLPTAWQGEITNADGGSAKPTSGTANVLEVVWLESGTYEVTYEVQVPSDATAGDYTVDAEGSGISPTDGSRIVDSTQTTITVEEEQTNTAPTAEAGSDQTVDEGADVTLDASGSSDPDGDSLSYSWSQTGGDSVSLSDGSSATPSFTAPSVDSETTLTFEVTVADGNGGTDTDTVSVTVQPINEDPTASISGPTSAQVGQELTFTASASDDGSIASYSWDLGDGTTATSETVSHTYESAGDYDVSLTVTDDQGATTTATQTVSVGEAPDGANLQVSNLNAPASATQGDTVDVSATVENTGDEEATQTVEFTFDGSVLDSQEVTLAGGASQQVDFSVDTSGVAPGTYTHGVSTEDDSATAQITVTDLPPVGGFENASTDADGDGKLEDVNGDGEFNVVDVQALFANREDSTVQNNPEQYDFNGDGKFDVVDVQALFVELTGGDS